jgi:hypothetical protein
MNDATTGCEPELANIGLQELYASPSQYWADEAIKVWAAPSPVTGD